jgi:hypothetical protein
MELSEKMTEDLGRRRGLKSGAVGKEKEAEEEGGKEGKNGVRRLGIEPTLQQMIRPGPSVSADTFPRGHFHYATAADRFLAKSYHIIMSSHFSSRGC